jgi:hypothetical protein
VEDPPSETEGGAPGRCMRKTAAVPKVGWPAKGSSPSGLKRKKEKKPRFQSWRVGGNCFGVWLGGNDLGRVVIWLV